MVNEYQLIPLTCNVLGEGGGVSWGGAGVCWLLGRVVILTPFLWDFFFFHCIVLQISMRFEMTFLIKNKMEKKQACKFWPHCFMGKTNLLSHRIYI